MSYGAGCCACREGCDTACSHAELRDEGWREDVREGKCRGVPQVHKSLFGIDRSRQISISISVGGAPAVAARGHSQEELILRRRKEIDTPVGLVFEARSNTGETVIVHSGAGCSGPGRQRKERGCFQADRI